MNVDVNELMTKSVVTTQPHAKIGHVRALLGRNRIGAVPVVDSHGHPVGIVSAADLVADLNPSSPVRTIMTEKVFTVPRYADVSVAARLMRNHRIHRVVVTHEQKVVGVLSSFDLLQLVEGHRFVAKQAPTGSKRGTPRR